MNCKMHFLKIDRLLELQMLMSNLFHLMIFDGRQVCVVLKEDKLYAVLVVINECLTGIKLMGY